MQAKRGKRQKGAASKYAQKLKSGNMMYGPGCCAHRIKLRIEDMPNARRLRNESEKINRATPIDEEISSYFNAGEFLSVET